MESTLYVYLFLLAGFSIARGDILSPIKKKLCCTPRATSWSREEGTVIVTCQGYHLDNKCQDISCQRNNIWSFVYPCPNNCFYVHTLKWCVTLCPDGTYKDLLKPGYCSLCQEICKTCFGPNELDCSSCFDGYYYFKRKCLHQCPPNTFAYKSECMYNCPALIYDSKCLDSCPSGMYQTNRTCKACMSTCISCTNENTCITCQPKLIFHEGNCIETCPESLPFLNNGNCLAVCPVYATGYTCTSTCDTSWLLYNNMCVEFCPDNASFNKSGTCVTKCPNAVMNTTTCIDHCPRSMYQIEDYCVYTCPADYPIIDESLKCLKVCNQLQFDNFCYKICPSPAMVVFKGNCTFECPEGFPRIDLLTRQCKECINYRNECLTKCPFGTYYNVEEDTCELCDPECINCYGSSAEECYDCVHYKSSTGCVVSCPPNEPYIKNDNMCVGRCPKHYVKPQMNCVDSCPISYIPMENYSPYLPNDLLECVKCHYYQNQCETYCPYNTYMNISQNSCMACDSMCLTCHGPNISDCLRCQYYNSSKGCITSCSETDDEIFKIENNNVFPYGKQCTKTCPDNFIHDFLNMTCVQKCNMPEVFEYNRTCVTECPDKTFLVYKENQNSHKCVDECPPDYISVNFTCVINCPNDYLFYHEARSVCLESCPIGYLIEEYPAKILIEVLPFKTYHQTLKKCLKHCSSNFYEWEDKCVIKCPKGYNFYTEQNRLCLTKCPDEFYVKLRQYDLFSDLNMIPCIQHCSSFEVTINQQKQCIDKCPQGYPFMHYNICVKKSYYYSSDIAVVILSLLLEMLTIFVCVKYERKTGFTKLLFVQKKKTREF